MKQQLLSSGRSVTHSRFLERSWPICLIAAVWLIFFWPMLIGQTVCGFRDSAYLYYPLFHWIDSVWASGEIPLWNPHCNYGMPVVGDGSSSLFYPGKLIFFFRFLSFESRYGIYLAGHVLLASLGAYWLSNQLGCNRFGATFAALAYGFGGPVLFQVTNIIYGVGAAWLPIGIGCVLRMIDLRSVGWMFVAGTCVAMLILGGDPQMGYHLILISGATILFRFRSLPGNASRLLGMILIGSVLAAVQIMPILDWSQHSVRNEFLEAKNIYEFILRNSDAPVGNAIPLFIQEPTGPHAEIYQFSQPPWLLTELIWPNSSGRMFPIHSRWVDGLPGSDRVWFPSLYLGCLTILFAALSFRLWSEKRGLAWLSWVAIAFCLGSFGWYGIGWFVKEFSLAQKEIIGSPTGSVYWMMVTFLPKYVSFRYPAKLFIVASLMISVLAGRSLSEISESEGSIGVRSKRLRTLGASLLILSIVVAAISQSVLPFAWLADALSSLTTTNQFGRLDVEAARNSICLGAVHASAVLCVVLLLSWFGAKRTVFATIVLLFLSADLIIANYWLTAQIDSASFSGPVGVASQESKFENSHSEKRLEEVVVELRSSKIAKMHLLDRSDNPNSFASLEPYYVSRLSDFERVPDLCVVADISEWPLRIKDRKEFEGLLQARTETVRQIDSLVDLEVKKSPGRKVVISGTTEQPAWLCRKSLFDAGWTARIAGEAAYKTEIERWQVLFQAVKIPAGEWTVEFNYQPMSFFWGAWISILGWIAMLGLLVRFARK